MNDFVDTGIADGVLSITINRPAKKNALTSPMYAALGRAFVEGNANPAVKVVQITGAGDAFTAGNDIAEFAAATGEQEGFDAFLTGLMHCEKPVVAAVNGFAIGIGFTLLLHCDFVYASESAYLKAPFVDLALVPEAGSTLLLPALVGRLRAADIFLSGRKIMPAEAVQLGLVTEAFAQATFREAVAARLQTLSRKPLGALIAIKKLLRSSPADIEARVRREQQVFDERLASEEAQEIFANFLSPQPQ